MSQVALSIRNNSNRSKKTTSISGRVGGEKQEKNGVFGASPDATSMAQSAPSLGPGRPFFAISRGGKRKAGAYFRRVCRGLLGNFSRELGGKACRSLDLPRNPCFSRQLHQRWVRQGLTTLEPATKAGGFSATLPKRKKVRESPSPTCHENMGFLGNFAFPWGNGCFWQALSERSVRRIAPSPKKRRNLQCSNPNNWSSKPSMSAMAT